jgi:vesicle transport protein SEC22
MKTLKPTSPQRCTLEGISSFLFHYTIDQNIIYLILVEREYPRRLAFQFLEEVSKNFNRTHGQEAASATRPYACVEFGEFLDCSL